MLSFDKGTNLSLPFKFILSERLSKIKSVRIRCFTILRIHRYSTHFLL